MTPDSVVTSDRKREAQSLRSKVDGFLILSLPRSRHRSAVLGRMLTSWQRRARAQNDFATSQSDACAAPGFRLALGKFGLTAESGLNGEWLGRTTETPWVCLVISRALAGREVRFEVSGEELERAFNGRTGHGNEIAEALIFVESEDLAELVEDRLAALPLLHFLQQ